MSRGPDLRGYDNELVGRTIFIREEKESALFLWRYGTKYYYNFVT